MARELLTGTDDHRLHGLVSLGSGQRIGVGAVFDPQVGDGRASSIGIRLVPDRDVAINHAPDRCCGAALCHSLSILFESSTWTKRPC